jgi:hypothetical protein
MDAAPAFILSFLTVIAILIIAAYVWYNSSGWATFSYKTGDSTSCGTQAKPKTCGPCWTPKIASNGASGSLSDLRFKNAIFTLNVGGQTYTKDVTAVLNSMAVAYQGTGSATANTGSLCLDKPLNAFSFLIQNVNDSTTVPDPTIPVWKAATVTLTGSYRTL